MLNKSQNVKERATYMILRGDVWYDSRSCRTVDNGKNLGISAIPPSYRRVCGPRDMIAFVYDLSCNALLKHGRSDGVRSWFADIKNRLDEHKISDPFQIDFCFVEFAPTDNSLRFLNGLIQYSGVDISARIKQFSLETTQDHLKYSTT